MMMMMMMIMTLMMIADDNDYEPHSASASLSRPCLISTNFTLSCFQLQLSLLYMIENENKLLLLSKLITFADWRWLVPIALCVAWFCFTGDIPRAK